MGSLMGDIGSMLGVNTSLATNSTSRKDNTELNMEDFLKLMIVQLTHQTIDDAMDTSEMMNQMIQMQMISAITNMTEINIQSYANSLVGKVVTVGIVSNNMLEEREIVVMGTGTYNGQQVIFGHDGNMYFLNQIMAVGRLPDADGNYGVYAPEPGPGEGEGDSYIFTDDDGNETTVYYGKDGEQDWYYGEVDGKETVIYVGEDGKPGGGDDWYDNDGTPTLLPTAQE